MEKMDHPHMHRNRENRKIQSFNRVEVYVSLLLVVGKRVYLLQSLNT